MSEWRTKFAPKKKERNANSHSARNHKRIDSVCCLANLRLQYFLVSFRGEFFDNGFLKLFSINSVAFGGVCARSSFIRPCYDFGKHTVDPMPPSAATRGQSLERCAK
jgi:hypothetical protein